MALQNKARRKKQYDDEDFSRFSPMVKDSRREHRQKRTWKLGRK